MINLKIHRATNINFNEVGELKPPSGEPFYTQDLVINVDDGSSLTITLFYKNLPDIVTVGDVLVVGKDEM